MPAALQARWKNRRRFDASIGVPAAAWRRFNASVTTGVQANDRRERSVFNPPTTDGARLLAAPAVATLTRSA
jgi:hypothetical protein